MVGGVVAAGRAKQRRGHVHRPGQAGPGRQVGDGGDQDERAGEEVDEVGFGVVRAGGGNQKTRRRHGRGSGGRGRVQKAPRVAPHDDHCRSVARL